MSSREDLRCFYALRIDHNTLGLAPWEDQKHRYFCTPKDARIFGGPGVDGIHYVLLPEDERIFCVDPGAGEEGMYVLPVGGNFRDFLSYTLYCRDESPLAQLWRLDEAGFRKLLEENAQLRWPGCEAFLEKKAEALKIAGKTFQLEPRDPFSELKNLQREFRPSELSFADEYYDILGLEKPGGGVKSLPKSWLRVKKGGNKL